MSMRNSYLWEPPKNKWATKKVWYVFSKTIASPSLRISGQGAVYVYTHSNETISLSQTLYSEGKALDQFGYDVASSGPWLAIGAIGVDGALDADVVSTSVAAIALTRNAKLLIPGSCICIFFGL